VGRVTELLVGLTVRDEAGYAAYRAAMAPLLEGRGGSFGVDVRVAEVLRGPGPFNRLFTLRFPSAAARDAFFADPAYLAVRARLFDPSVEGAPVMLGRYDVAA
jgi:uncharacterized protein (DUF1330 family)